MDNFNLREPYFKPDQYILEGFLDVKSWASTEVSSGFGRSSFKKIRNRMHTWRRAYCTLDIRTSQFQYYKLAKNYAGDIIPNLEELTPKVSVLINESDVMDIEADKHGKSYNFMINLCDRNQILMSTGSEEMKQRWMFTFQNMDDIRDDIVLSNVNSPRKVFAMKKSKSSAPKSFRRMPSLDGQVSSIDIEDEEERQLAELARSCLEDSEEEDDESDEDTCKESITHMTSVDDSDIHHDQDIEVDDSIQII